MNVEKIFISDKITDDDINKVKSLIADEKIVQVIVAINSRGGYVGDLKTSDFIALMQSDKLVAVIERSHEVMEYFNYLADKRMKIGTKVKLNK